MKTLLTSGCTNQRGAGHCPELHLKRLNSLTLACHALLDCKTLTLTELGRNLPTKARTKH
ncbi:hypothetical protein ACFH5Q_21675, partial [Escherichia coli]